MLYEIAEHRLRLTFTTEGLEESYLPSFQSFQVYDDGKTALVDILVDDNIKSIPLHVCRLIRDVDTGNGTTAVYRFPYLHRETPESEPVKKEGYYFLIRDIWNKECAVLMTTDDFKRCRLALRGANDNSRKYGLNSSIMLAYAYATAPFDTLLIHASVVRKDGVAYAFTAKSGTGKSTQVSNWLRYLPNCDLLNDDNPVMRVIDGKVYIYGSPWSGKTPCYRNIKAPLGGVAQIYRDSTNYLEFLRPTKRFTVMLPACSSMKWDERIYGMKCDTLAKIIESVPVFNLHCLPDPESAFVASQGMSNPESITR